VLKENTKFATNNPSAFSQMATKRKAPNDF
jgi:hypothetical protein